MRRLSKNALGLIMICISALGLILSIFLVVEVWHFRQPVIDKLQSGLDISSALLQTTDDGLVVINQVVRGVYTSTLDLSDATDTLAQTLDSTGQFMDSASTFVGKDLINTITNTQAVLNSAQDNAIAIDNILTTLSKIPLIGFKYTPDLPLNTALKDVSASLDPVQESLKSLQANLDTTQTNMKQVSDQMVGLDVRIMTINKNLTQAQTTIDSYQSQVDSLMSSVDHAKTALPKWVTTTAWILSIIIFWLVLVQIGILLQGITLLSPEQAKVETLAEQPQPEITPERPQAEQHG